MKQIITFSINHLSNNHSIYVVEINNKIIASITIIIEAKLIHHLSFVCHIEDLVIDYRNMGLARKLLNVAKDISKKNNCYKIIWKNSTVKMDFINHLFK